MKRFMRAWCWMTWHDWNVIACEPLRAAMLGHLHPMAGCAGYCRRCGEIVDYLSDSHKRQKLSSPSAQIVDHS